MSSNVPDLQSKRAREFVVRGEDAGEELPVPLSRAAEKV